MKKIYLSVLFVAFTVAFWACANGPKVDDPELFKTKTGVIGVFRQPAFYCSEASAQYMQLGDSTVLVKPAWSEDQDNLFIMNMPVAKISTSLCWIPPEKMVPRESLCRNRASARR